MDKISEQELLQAYANSPEGKRLAATAMEMPLKEVLGRILGPVDPDEDKLDTIGQEVAAFLNSRKYPETEVIYVFSNLLLSSYARVIMREALNSMAVTKGEESDGN